MVGWPYFLSGELYGAALRYDRRMDYHSSLFPSCPPLRATSLSSSHALSLSLSLACRLFLVPSRLVSSRLVSFLRPLFRTFFTQPGFFPLYPVRKLTPQLVVPSPSPRHPSQRHAKQNGPKQAGGSGGWLRGPNRRRNREGTTAERRTEQR